MSEPGRKGQEGQEAGSQLRAGTWAAEEEEGGQDAPLSSLTLPGETMRRKRQGLLGEFHLGAQRSTASSGPSAFCSHHPFQGVWAHPRRGWEGSRDLQGLSWLSCLQWGYRGVYEPCSPLSRKAAALLQTGSDTHTYLKKKRKGRKAILFHCQTVHFKYPFYYSICIVIPIIDLAGSSNEAREYKVSNKVNCCL